MAELIFIQNAGGGGASEDRFAPRFVVGNVPAGDSAVPQVTSFTYVPDAGDGLGIAAALAAAGPGGSVFVRRGVYVTEATLVVPDECLVVGEGRSTSISVDGPSNILFDLGVGAGLRDMALSILGTGVDTACLVHMRERSSLRSLLMDLSAAFAPMNGAVFITGTGLGDGIPRTILDDVEILLPIGAGGVPATWMTGVRGDAIADHVAELVDVRVFQGDAGALTEGVELQFDGCDFDSQAVGFYADGGSIRAQGRETVVRPNANVTHGCKLVNGDFVLMGTRFMGVNSLVPCIYISGGAGTAKADVCDCKIESGYSPVIVVGDAFELTEDVLVHGNRIALQANVVPVEVGAGADNTNIYGNVTRGSSRRPTTLGTGTNVGTDNIWGP